MRASDVGSPLGSVDRALQLILALRDESSLSVKEAAARLDVAPSTAHRLLAALAHRGFATQDHQRRYRPGPTLGEVFAEPITLSQLRNAAREPLSELHDEVGETVHVMILRGRHIQFVDGFEGSAALRVGLRIGDRMPAFASAGGKALLAELNPSDLDHVFAAGLPPWPNSAITSLAELKRHLAVVRRTGFGTNVEETEQGVVGIGIAVHSSAGVAVGAVTIAVPTARLGPGGLDDVVPNLRRCRDKIQDRLAKLRFQ